MLKFYFMLESFENNGCFTMRSVLLLYIAYEIITNYGKLKTIDGSNEMKVVKVAKGYFTIL